MVARVTRRIILWRAMPRATSASVSPTVIVPVHLGVDEAEDHRLVAHQGLVVALDVDIVFSSARRLVSSGISRWGASPRPSFFEGLYPVVGMPMAMR